MKSCASPAPNPSDALSATTKVAGMAELSWGALVGALVGQVSKSIPQIEMLRASQPQLYAATLGAAVAALTKHETEEERQPEPALMQAPGWSV